MQTSLQSLTGSQFLQAGFLKARLLVSRNIFLEAGPRIFLSFMREDKQAVTLEIFWAPDEINTKRGDKTYHAFRLARSMLVCTMALIV